MNDACPRCGAELLPAARFCARCGLLLTTADGTPVQPGRTAHPEPLPIPEAMRPVPGTEALFWRWEAAGGGEPLLGTEPLDVAFFNAGYALSDVRLRIIGKQKDRREVLRTERLIEEFDRGELYTAEVPSWELQDLVKDVQVEFLSAAFAPLK